MKHQCTVCGFIYDDDKERVPFDQLPDDWVCPMCGAAKSDFVLMEEEPEEKVRTPVSAPGTEDVGLSVGQMSALFSNLARGCEKQYRFEDMERFRQLADYFSAVTPAVPGKDVDDLSSMLLEDISEGYPAVKAAAEGYSDRGALRVQVWGDKVTRMLSSLVKRYLVEGEKLLADTEIWVCSVCGFTYIGDEPPEICPVCKVPGWKFTRIEREAVQ